MTIANGIQLIIGAYFLIGSIVAYVNQCTVNERKRLVGEILAIRTEAFQNGFRIDVDTSIFDSVGFEINPNEAAKETEKKEVLFVPVPIINTIVGLVIAFLWLFKLQYIVEDRRALKHLRSIRNSIGSIFKCQMEILEFRTSVGKIFLDAGLAPSHARKLAESAFERGRDLAKKRMDANGAVEAFPDESSDELSDDKK